MEMNLKDAFLIHCSGDSDIMFFSFYNNLLKNKIETAIHIFWIHLFSEEHIVVVLILN